MNNVLKNLSVKSGLTAVLGLFTALIILVAALGYQSSTLGASSIDELNRINIEQLNALNRAQVNIADTQLFFLNHLDALNEGSGLWQKRISKKLTKCCREPRSVLKSSQQYLSQSKESTMQKR
ncbi:hypothetical protein HSBAA_20940 [Vreelandella sulfidaeris]|uniref:Chemotaxis methyl-accepting receptor Tar-related ligand-binding domain-containing protein n=1 Tax=Vreelandella sulfidaeris TaxID=115553 RepID=A0A455U951_9GAMM|nr:hypothetical protein HSBAA_20940 [Halomonas sulfidaeris]